MLTRKGTPGVDVFVANANKKGDIVFGYGGNDRFTAGPKSDTFVFDHSATGHTAIDSVRGW
jgi:hypothetical protein